MLKVREVVQNSLIWFDEPEKEVIVQKVAKKKDESSEEESDDEDDLLADESDAKSPHEYYRDFVFA